MGHRKEACRNSPTIGAPAEAAHPTVVSTGKADTGDVKFNGQVAKNGITEIGFGEWMIVSRKSKWPNRSSGPFKSEAQSEGFKYRNNNHKSYSDSDLTGPSKVQSNGPMNKRGPLLRNSAQQNQAQSKKPINNLSSDPKGSRFNPLIESDNDKRPQPVLVPIKSGTAQKQKGKGQLTQEVSRP